MNKTYFPDDIPANPLEKPGYRLDFYDEFDGTDLDTAKWLPFHLPQWSSRASSAPNYQVRDSTLMLQITEEQQPWCPEFDGHNRCSSLQTGVFAGPLGSAVGQHRFSQACVVREEQEPARTYTPHYGYFEIRAKGVANPLNHVALWMIGYEDAPEKSGEIAIMEIMGKGVTAQGSFVGYGVHPWGDPTLVDEFFEDPLPIDATRYHIYAAEWTPTQIDFYVDNQKIRTIDQSPNYPMQFMLGIYERPQQGDGAVTRDPSQLYPKTFTIDYFRAYQPVGGYTSLIAGLLAARTGTPA
jgi:hypothetical protein